MKKFFRYFGYTLLCIIAIVGILWVGFKIYIALNSADDPLMDDSDLIPKITVVADEDNGWFELKEAEKAMYYPKEQSELIGEMASGEDWNADFAQELVERNEEAYKHFYVASQKPYIVSPKLNKLAVENYNFSFEPESQLHIRSLARLSIIRARYLVTEGGSALPVKIVQDLHKVGASLQESPNPDMITYLVGLSLKNIAYEFIEDQMNHFNREERIALQNMLSIIPGGSDSLERVMQSEYVMFKNSIIMTDALGRDEFARERNIPLEQISKTNYYFKPNQSINSFGEGMKRMIEQPVSLCGDIHLVNEMAEELNAPGSIGYILTENAAGLLLTDVLNANVWKGLAYKKCSEDFIIIALNVRLATEGYKSGYGAYAATLNELQENEYLVKDVPEKLHDWDIVYDSEVGQLIEPDDENFKSL